MPRIVSRYLDVLNQCISCKSILIQVLFDQLQPPAEETDDTSGNTIDLSTVDSSPINPNMGKTVDLPLAILNAPPLHHLHQPQQV